MKVQELLTKLDKIMPLNLALKWDNVGLLLGDGKEEVERVLVTLDVSPRAIDKAIEHKCNLIISHHPLIFGKIAKITSPDYLRLIRANIDVISMHTNLDAIPQGVNGRLANILGLHNTHVISDKEGNKTLWCKVFLPEIATEQMISALNVGVGEGSGFNSYMVSDQVKSRYQIKKIVQTGGGESRVVTSDKEVELQFRVDSIKLSEVISIIKDNHPYKRPVYHFYEIEDNYNKYGIGMVGELEKALTLRSFAQFVKEKLSAPRVKLWEANRGDTLVKKVMVCGGTGSFLIPQARLNSDVLVTGDIKYHEMLEGDVPLIDAGHFFTEQPVLGFLKEILDDFGISNIQLSAQEHEISNLTII